MRPEESVPAIASGGENVEPPIHTEWDRVKEQHEKIVDALNDTAVSLTIRSAEGIAMFHGLSDTSTNGHVHELLEEGHAASVAQALGETPGDDAAVQDQPPAPAGPQGN